MYRTISEIGRKFISTESEWNPKVLVGRAVAALLPKSAFHEVEKAYYAYLLGHLPEDWQERDTALVRHLVGPGDGVVDIGASIGGYTKFLSALVGASGHVYGFEPNPPIYDCLAHNVKKLKLQNVEIRNCALSDTKGSASIAIPRYRWGSECHYDATLEATRASPGCRQVVVNVDTLDSFFADYRETISFIKCDVNYHELPCLRGGLQTIGRHKPAMLIEILRNPDKPDNPAAHVFELFRQNGYDGYWFDGKALRKRQHGERSQNYFFLTPEHFAKLSSRIPVL
jgi:FkbM family methyltransferase